MAAAETIIISRDFCQDLQPEGDVSGVRQDILYEYTHNDCISLYTRDNYMVFFLQTLSSLHLLEPVAPVELSFRILTLLLPLAHPPPPLVPPSL